MEKSDEPYDYVGFLIGNYRKGDWRLLESIAKKFKSEEIIHTLIWSYIDIYRANPSAECQKPLEAIYQKLTCGMHRRDLVEILIENNVLSKKIRNEIQFDCDEETRKLYD